MILMKSKQILFLGGLIGFICANLTSFASDFEASPSSTLDNGTFIQIAQAPVDEDEADSNSQVEDFEEEGQDDDNSFDDEFSLDDEVETIDVDSIVGSSTKVSNFLFRGFFKEDLAYSHAKKESYFSKIKSTLNLTLDWKISDRWKFKGNWNGFYDAAYENKGRDEFSDETLEAYETESEIREFYVDGSLPNQLYLKAGRQVIAWGESKASQITDMANPRNQRELGLIDLEDARIPVTATKLVALFDTLEFSLVAIHEIRGNKNAVEGSEFDPFISIRNAGIAVRDEELPDSDLDNTESLFRAYKSFNGGDVSLVWADTFDDSIHLDFYELSFGGPTPALILTPKHKRIKTVGATGNMVAGAWLFKAELAKKWDKAIARNDFTGQLQMLSVPASGKYSEESGVIKMWKAMDVVEGMIGIDYSGISNLTITVEAAGNKIENYESNLSPEELSSVLTLIFNYSAWNDTLQTKFTGILFSDNNGSVYRGNVEYDIIDALTVSGGLIYYEAPDANAMLKPYESNDKVFTSLKYSF